MQQKDLWSRRRLSTRALRCTTLGRRGVFFLLPTRLRCSFFVVYHRTLFLRFVSCATPFRPSSSLHIWRYVIFHRVFKPRANARRTVGGFVDRREELRGRHDCGRRVLHPMADPRGGRNKINTPLLELCNRIDRNIIPLGVDDLFFSLITPLSRTVSGSRALNSNRRESSAYFAAPNAARVHRTLAILPRSATATAAAGGTTNGRHAGVTEKSDYSVSNVRVNRFRITRRVRKHVYLFLLLSVRKRPTLCCIFFRRQKNFIKPA